jgi:hypothetical protein
LRPWGACAAVHSDTDSAQARHDSIPAKKSRMLFGAWLSGANDWSERG